MWFYKEDKTKPVITSQEQVLSEAEIEKTPLLGKTAVLLYLKGIEYIQEKYEVEVISEHFPRFLKACPVYKIKGNDNLCFLDGGRGAPMAVDTLEILKALGVENVISVGLIGSFVDDLDIGEIVVVNKAFVEEGTSLHYYESIDYSVPNTKLFNQLHKYFNTSKVATIVSTDTIYRQTFYKEELWRNKGCVGVDMETSALMSVGQYLKMNVASIMMVSDKHPVSLQDDIWQWKMTKDLRKQMLFQVIEFALSL